MEPMLTPWGHLTVANFHLLKRERVNGTLVFDLFDVGHHLLSVPSRVGRSAEPSTLAVCYTQLLFSVSSGAG